MFRSSDNPSPINMFLGHQIHYKPPKSTMHIGDYLLQRPQSTVAKNPYWKAERLGAYAKRTL